MYSGLGPVKISSTRKFAIFAECFHHTDGTKFPPKSCHEQRLCGRNEKDVFMLVSYS